MKLDLLGTKAVALHSSMLDLAWTGKRVYGLSQIQNVGDVGRAALGLVIITTLTSPGLFGAWQALRPQLVNRNIVPDTDEAIQREANVLLSIAVAFAAYVVSECLDCGH